MRLASLSFTLLCLVAAFSSCSPQYNIDGNSTIAGLDGQKMYLRATSSDGRRSEVPLDSCEVVHGCFYFGGVVDSVLMADLYMGDDPLMPVVIENGKVFMQVDNMTQSISGGPLNDRLNQFLTKHGRCERELWDLDRRARYMLYEGKTLEQIVAVIDPMKSTLLDRMKGLEVQFIKDNYDNVLGTGYFIRMCTDMGMPVANDAIFDILVDAPATFLANPFIANYMLMMGVTPEQLQKERIAKGTKKKRKK